VKLGELKMWCSTPNTKAVRSLGSSCFWSRISQASKVGGYYSKPAFTNFHRWMH